MAIDFFVMPISRYVTGAFVTPAMQLAWSQGLPYTLMGRETRQIPRDEPFGGPDAAERRAALLASNMLAADLAKYPTPIPANLWDEASETEPRFHRVDPRSYGALVDETIAAMAPTTRTWSSLFRRGAARRSHLAAQLFLPVELDEPFVTAHVFEGWRAGSVHAALRELRERRPASPSSEARETLREALEDAAELRLPLIVDV